jgi:predicted RNase H-like nuclease
MRSVAFAVTEHFATFLGQAATDSLIVIDIPIGLPQREPRVCDKEARALLRWPRRNSVFSPPARLAIDATTFEDAQRLNREALGVGLTIQSFCIMPKIREVDAVMTVARQQYIREAHPEVSFACLSGSPMEHNKTTPQGRDERILVLRTAGIDLSETWLVAERAGLGAARVSLDDLIDALACLATARHIHDGRGQSLGRVGQTDAKDLLMEIVTCAATGRAATA